MDNFPRLAFQRKGIQRQQQPPDGVFPQLRGAAVGTDALGLHEQAILGGCKAQFRRLQCGKPLGQLFGAGQLCAGRGWNHVGRGAAVQRNQLQIAHTIHFPLIGHIDNALLAVNHRVFTVRGKAHHRNLPAVGKVVFHILRAAFLIAAPEHPNSAADGQPGIPQSRQCI